MSATRRNYDAPAYEQLLAELENTKLFIAEEWLKLEKQARRKDRSSKSAQKILDRIQYFQNYKSGLITAIVALEAEQKKTGKEAPRA
jgi:hypothetical protein